MKFNPIKYYAHRTIKDIDDVNRLISDIKIMGWPTPEQCEDFYEQLKQTWNGILIDYYKRNVYDKQPHLSSASKKKKKERRERTNENNSPITLSFTTCRGKNLKFTKGAIHYGDYVMKTKQAFAVDKSIMRMVRGQYRVRLCHDKTFYFEKGHLPRLLSEVEKASHLYISCHLKEWAKNTMEKLYEFAAFVRDINFGVFVDIDPESFDTNTGCYKPILKDWSFELLNLWFHPTAWYPQYDWKSSYRSFVRGINNVSAIHKESYLSTHKEPLPIKAIENNFKYQIFEYIKQTCSYTKDDYEWDELLKNKRKGFSVSIKKIEDISVWDEYCTIDFPNSLTTIELNIRQSLPSGKVFEFTHGGISSIEAAWRNCMYNISSSVKTAIERCLCYIKREEWEEEDPWNCSIFGLKTTRRILIDINNDRYEECHPRCNELFTDYLRNKCSHILHFYDPNAHYSSDNNYPFRCYLLVRGKYIVLFSTNSDLSTYLFRINEEKVESAIFLIWAYFSSYLCNKREGKQLMIEYLFENFGIICYWRLDPITKNEDGSYNFRPYDLEYIVECNHWI